jgi:CRISPR-associated protein Csc1
MVVHTGTITLMEHTYFASRELGILSQTEPLLGNYALAYALGLAVAPFRVPAKDRPRYVEDLAPLNRRGLYVTPGTFAQEQLRFVLSQFNAQTESYYSRYDQGAIATTLKTARAANFPQAGRIRLLGQGSVATFHVLDSTDGQELSLPGYIRLGKLMSKARVRWQLHRAQEVQREGAVLPQLLNAVDLPAGMLPRTFVIHNLHPAPLLERAELSGSFWQLEDGTLLPVGMRFGVEDL